MNDTMSRAAALPVLSPHVLARTLRRGAAVRGAAALALGVYVVVGAGVATVEIARVSAAYWIVDGLVTFSAAGLARGLGIGTIVVLLRGITALTAGLVILALPLSVVSGPWAPGRGLLVIPVAALALAVVGVLIVAGLLDVLVSRAIRRRLPGEWSFALAAPVSILLAIVTAASIVMPAAFLGPALAATLILGGAGLLAAALRLDESRAASSRIARSMIFAVLALLAGCASSESTSWTKPGTTDDQVKRDRMECLSSAQHVVPGVEGPRMKVDYPQYQRCMAQRGYSAASSN